MEKLKAQGVPKDGLLKLFLKFSFGSLGAAAISFFTTPIVSALIVPDEFGRASMYVLISGLLMQVVLMGTDQSFVRKFYEPEYEGRPSAVLWNAMLVPLCLSLLIATLVVVFWERVSTLLIGAPHFMLALLLAVGVPLGILDRYSNLLLRMTKRAGLFSTLRIVAALAAFAVVLLQSAIKGYADFMGLVWGSIVSSVLVVGISIAVGHKVWLGKGLWQSSKIKGMLLYGLPFLPTFIIGWVFEGVDKIALRKYSTFFEIGLFSAGYKVVALLSILQAAFSMFWVPVANEAFASGSESSAKLFRRVFLLLGAISIVSSICLIAFKDLIMVIFDDSYSNAAPIVPMLVFMPIMYMLSEVTVNGINYRKKTYWHLVIALISSFVNVLLTYLLVPSLGAKGAAIATGTSYIVFFYARTLISERVMHMQYPLVKISIALLMVYCLAMYHTFYSGLVPNCVAGLAGIIALLLYKSEFRELLSIARNKLFPRRKRGVQSSLLR